MEFSFSKLNLPSFSKFGKKSKVKDHLPPYLGWMKKYMIEIHSKAIDHLDRTSIFSHSNSKNKLDFNYFLEFAKKFTSKKINYGKIIYLINLSSNLPTRVFILSSSAFHSSHAVFIAPKNYCFIFTVPHPLRIRESYELQRKNLLATSASQFFLIQLLMHLPQFILTSL